MYGTQALNVARWKLNCWGHLFCMQTSYPFSKNEYIFLLITDVRIQSTVENSFNVTTTAAEAAHRRRVGTSRLHASTHVERLDS